MINFGGWQKISLIDYPGHIATVVFSNGCPFRCPYCHNPSLVIPPFKTQIPATTIWSYLKSRQGKIQGVVITGGEPTLQPALTDFIKKCRALQYKIKLDTNGYYPAVVKKLTEQGLINYLAMDIKTSLENYPSFTKTRLDVRAKISDSIKIIKAARIPYEFRSTIIEGVHDLDTISAMSKLIKGAENYILQGFVPQKELVDQSYANHPTTSREFLIQAQQRCQPYVKQCSIR